jgi:hypothetical protein
MQRCAKCQRYKTCPAYTHTPPWALQGNAVRRTRRVMIISPCQQAVNMQDIAKPSVAGKRHFSFNALRELPHEMSHSLRAPTELRRRYPVRRSQAERTGRALRPRGWPRPWKSGSRFFFGLAYRPCRGTTKSYQNGHRPPHSEYRLMATDHCPLIPGGWPIFGVWPTYSFDVRTATDEAAPLVALSTSGHHRPQSLASKSHKLVEI